MIAESFIHDAYAGYDGRRLGQCALNFLKYLLPTVTLLSDSNQKVAPVIQAVRLLALRINERTTAVFWPTEFEALETRA